MACRYHSIVSLTDKAISFQPQVSFSIKFQSYLEEIHLPEKLASFSLWFNELNHLGKEGFGKLNGEAGRLGRKKYVELEEVSMDMVKTHTCTRFASDCHLNIMKTSASLHWAQGRSFWCYLGWSPPSVASVGLWVLPIWGQWLAEEEGTWQSSLLLHSCLSVKKTTSVFKTLTRGAVKGYVYTMDLASEVSSGGVSFFPAHEGLESAASSGYCCWHTNLYPHWTGGGPGERPHRRAGDRRLKGKLTVCSSCRGPH